MIVRPAVSCMFNDLECIKGAEESGEDVQITDENGEPVVDEEGNPVSDPEQAAVILGPSPLARPRFVCLPWLA